MTPSDSDDDLWVYRTWSGGASCLLPLVCTLCLLIGKPAVAWGCWHFGHGEFCDLKVVTFAREPEIEEIST